MSKNSKISSLKPHLSPIMDKIVIANDSEYGGIKARNASPLASIGQVIAAKAKSSGSRPVGKQDWLQMGKDMYDKRNTAKKDSINAVCDTLSAYAIYVINGIINFNGKFELFKNPAPTHHHFVVVDRADKSDPNDSTTWGANCFVIDLWHAKRDHTITLRGCCETANHWKHGIYRNPGEHVYSGANYKKICEHSWIK
jgi:hypothetical protein